MGIIKVKKITDRQYEVNGKTVFKNTDEQWQCSEPLTESEHIEFRLHLKRKENNHRFFKK